MKMTNEMKRRSATRTRKRVRGEKKTTMGNAVVLVLLTLTLATMGMTPSAIAFAFNDANAASPASSSSAASAVTTTTEEETSQLNDTTTTSDTAATNAASDSTAEETNNAATNSETQVDSTSSSSTSNANDDSASSSSATNTNNDSTSSSSATASDSASSAASSTENTATSDASSASAATEKRTISKSIKSADGTIYIVEIAFDETAGIPDDAQLDVVEYVQIPDDYAEKKDTAYKDRPYETERFLSKEDLTELSSVTAKGMSVDEHGFVFFNKFLDLSITSNGQAIQLQAPVKVTVDTNAVSVDESYALEVGMLAYDEVLARDSQAFEDGRVTKDGKSARDMQRVNVTGEREEKTGEIPADRGAVKLQFQTDKLGEMALVGIVEPRLFVETEDAGTVTALAARTFAVDSQDVSVQVPEGREAAAAFRLTTNPEPNYGSKVWLTYAPEGDAATGYLVKNGELSNELFSKNGTPVPATIESGDSIALVRSVSTDDATSADAAGTVPGAKPDANAGDSSQTDPTVLEKTLTWDGHTYKVQATYGPETGIPATGTYLVANRYQKGSAEYDKYIQQAATALGVDPGQVTGVPIDISIVDNNLNTCNPAEGTTVDVSVTLLDNAAQSIPEGDSRVMHFDAEGEPEVITAKASSVDGGARQVTFETKGFSVFLLLGPAETKGNTDANTNGNTRDATDPQLAKTLSSLEGSWATWTITVNSDAAKLNESEEQQLTLKDTFTDNQSIDYSSIRVTEGVTYDYRGRTGTFVIPDKTTVEISYRTRVSASPGETVYFGNTATLFNASGTEIKSETTDESRVIYPSASDVAVTTGLYMVKFYVYADANMQSGISGAQFILLNENHRPMTYKLSTNGHNAGDPVTFTTDSEGFADIKIDTVPGEISIEKNTQYYVEMIKAPQDFKKDNGLYGFIIKDNPNYDNYEYYNGDTLKVRLYPEGASLNVTKRFSGNYNLRSDQKNSIEFVLEKKNADGTWDEAGVERHYYSDIVDRSSSMTFNNGTTIPLDLNATYRVIEKNAVPWDLPNTVDHKTTYYLSIGSESADSGDLPQEFTFTEDDQGKSINVVIDNEYEKHELTITKMDKMTGTKLPGAIFTAKRAEDDSSVKSYTTDNNGVITISGGPDFDAEVLYYIEETKAPANYLLPITPVKIYFYFSNDPELEPSIPEGETGVNLTDSYASVTLDNQRELLTIPVMKTWQGNNWPANVDRVVVGLYKSVRGGKPTAVTDGSHNLTVTLTKQAPYNNDTFTNLPARDDDNNTITYSIQEEHIYTSANGNQDILNNYVKEYGISDAGVYVVRNSPATTLTVNKEWYNRDGSQVTDASTQPDVTFDVYRSTSPIASAIAEEGITHDEMESFVSTLEKVRSDVSFGNSESWQKQIIDLPKKDDLGQRYYYYALETVPSFRTETYEVNEESGTVLIKNQVLPETTSVTVAKAALKDDPRPEAANTDFEFTLALTLKQGNKEYPIRGYQVAEGLVTDRDGKVTFKLKPENSTDLNLPVGVNAAVTEAENPEYTVTTASGISHEDIVRGISFVVPTPSSEQPSITFTNTLRVICKVIENGTPKPFESFKSALAYVRANPDTFAPGQTVAIYMLEDYTMPATDVFDVKADEKIVLTTAATVPTETDKFPYKPNPDRTEDIDTAIITRGADDGSMITSAGILTLDKVIMDGAKGSHTISDDGGFVNSSGTLNLKDTVKLRNSSTTGKGGAIYSTGTINMSGGSVKHNEAKNGSAVYLASGTMNMTGGSIDNNTGAEDGAVVPATTECKINLSGNPVIFDNKNSNKDWANVYLGVDSNFVINVVAPGLGDSANIGVRAMVTHREIGEQFATTDHGVTANLNRFINDMYEYRGKVQDGTADNVVWDGLTLKLSKVFDKEAIGANANDEFAITLSSTSIKKTQYLITGTTDYVVTPASGGNPGTIVFGSVKADDEITISPLPVGEYTIAEAPSNYTPSYSGMNDDEGADFEIENGKFSLEGNSTVTATNTRRLADVDLTKTLDDRLVGEDPVPFGFTITLTDGEGKDKVPIVGFPLADGVVTDPNGQAVVTMLPKDGASGADTRNYIAPVGATMTIKEHENSNYKVEVSGQTNPSSGESEKIADEDTDNDKIFAFQVTDDGAAVTFSNERKMAEIELGKVLTGKVSKTESFGITVTLTEKNEQGQYSPVANYVLHRDLEHPEKNIVTGEDGKALITFTFTGNESPDPVELTVPYGTKLEAEENLNTHERDIYNTTYSINEGNPTTGLKATIDSVSDTDKSIIFTNARKMRTVTVTNTVSGYSGNVVPFTYTATVTDGGQGQDDYDEHGFVDGVQTFELTNGQTQELIVPYGAELTIKESFIVGYKTTVKHGAENPQTALQDKFTVADNVTVAFTNRQLIGLRLINNTSNELKNVKVTVSYGTEIYRVNETQTDQEKINNGSDKNATLNIGPGKTAILEILHETKAEATQDYEVEGFDSAGQSESTLVDGYYYTINNEPSFHEYADPAVQRVYDAASFDVKGKLRYSVSDSMVTFTAQPLVSFDVNGGAWTTAMEGYHDKYGDGQVYQYAVKAGETVGQPTAPIYPTAEEIEFLGWTTEEAFAKAGHTAGEDVSEHLYNFDLPVNEPVTLYAIWSKPARDTRVVTVKNACTDPLTVTATTNDGEPVAYDIPANGTVNLTAPKDAKLVLQVSPNALGVSSQFVDADTADNSFTIASVTRDGTVAFLPGICKITDSDGAVLYDGDGKPAVYTTLEAAFTAYNGTLYTDASHTITATQAAVKMLIDEYAITKMHSFPSKSMVLTTADKDDSSFPYVGMRDRSTFYRYAQFTDDSLFALEGNNTREIKLTNIVLDGNSERGVKVANTKNGGLISVGNTKGMLIVNSGTTLRNVEFADYTNTNNSRGGAINMTGGTLSVNAGMFSNLHAYQGGAICSTAGQLNVAGTQGSTQFKDCYAEKADGGAIYYRQSQPLSINGGTDKENPGIIFTGCVASYSNGSKNDASDGGAIYVNTNGAQSASISGCSFTECSAKTEMETNAGYGGGAICANNVAGLTVSNCVFAACDTLSRGGAIVTYVANGKTVSIEDSSFDKCNCRGQGGALAVYQPNQESGSASADAKKTKLITTSCDFSNCSSGTQNGSGGAIQCYVPCMEFTDSTFTDCWAGKEGGAVNNYFANGYTVTWTESYMTMSGCSFKRCRAEDRYDPTALQHYGGGVNTKVYTATITDSNFEDCVSTLKEGGALHLGGQGGGSTATVTGSTFKNCTAKNGGGALLSSNETLEVTNSNFYGCSSSASNGGAIYHYKNSRGDSTQKYTTITDCIFGVDPDKPASLSCSAAQNGGAIWTRATTNVTLSNLTINGSSANYGGGVYLNSTTTTVSITDGSITNCQAVQGSAVYVGNKATFSGNLSVAGNTVSDINDGAIHGGKLYFEGKVKVENNTCSDDSTYKHDVLMQNNNDTTIYTTENGLEQEAHIGVYVPDRYFNQRGIQDKSFGTCAGNKGNEYLENFFNDRDEGLLGYQKNESDNKIYWGYILCKITDAEGNILKRPNGKDAVYQRLTLALSEFTSVTGGSPVYIKMLVEEYNIQQTQQIENFPAANVTLTTERYTGTESVEHEYDGKYPYRGTEGTVCTISRTNSTYQLFKLNNSGATLQLKNITLDGRKNKSTTTTKGDYRLIEAAQGALIVNDGTTMRYGYHNDSSRNDGGAIYATNASVTINGAYDAERDVIGVQFLNCTVEGDNNGGAICANNLTINPSDENDYGTAFIGCKARRAGAICVNGATLTIDGALFESCESLSEGGAIYHINTINGATTHINNSEFKECQSKNGKFAYGGAVHSKAPALTISGCKFTDCTSASNGGAIYHGDVNSSHVPVGNRETTSISDTVFTGCATNGTDSGFGTGGSIYTQAKTVEVTNCSINNSTACDNGGALYCRSEDGSSSTTISGTTFNNCSVSSNGEYGGAIYSRGKTLTIQDDVNDNPSVINACKAPGYSGAVYMSTNGSAVNISGSTRISGCYANQGGAIYLKSGVTLNLSDSPEFTRNGYNITLDEGIVNAEKGACIYLAEGSKINLQNSPKFSRNNIINSGKNAQERITNGGITDFVRQDLYLAGYSGQEYASSINVSAELTGDTIWVWPENDPHKMAGQQFATTDSGVSDASLGKLRNALADDTTDCTHGEFLAGVRLTGAERTYVFWSKMYKVSFDKKDNKAVAVPGAGFTLFTDSSCSPETAYTSASSANGVDDAGADGSRLDKGVVEFASVPIGAYYMKETSVPVSFRPNNTTYLVLVGTPYLSPNEHNKELWENNGPLDVENAANLVARYTTGAGKYYGIFALQETEPNVYKADLSKSITSPTVGVVNMRSDYEAYFMKVDGSNAALPEAGFTIYAQVVDDRGVPETYDNNYPVLTPWSRDGENPDPVKSADGSNDYKKLDGTNVPKGMVYFRELPIGTYYLMETIYPTRNGNGRISYYVEDDRVFKLEVNGDVDSDGQSDFTLSEWQETGDYVPVATDDQGNYTVSNAEAVCKLTDNDNNLLYRLGHDGKTKLPAIYSTLEAGFAAAQSDGLVSSNTDAVGDSDSLKLKALKDYTLNEPVIYSSSRALTFTTAGRANEKDKYVFATNRTSDTSRAEIKRNYSADSVDGALITVGDTDGNGANLALQNINLNGQSSSYNGRAIHVVNGSLSVQNNAQLQNFKHTASEEGAAIKGGAVLMDAGTSLAIDGGYNRSAVFTNNEVNGDGGAISIGDNRSFSIINAQFTGNEATAGNGGAVSIAENSSTENKRAITLQNVVFNSNLASDQGGAIYVGSKYGMTLQNADMHSNEASYGSAVYVGSNVDLTVTNGTISGNKASAENNGGAINGAGDNKFIFVGSPVVKDNYGTTSGQQQKNVVLSVDSNEVINTTEAGLLKSADIGVYVIDGEGGSIFKNHGNPSTPFGTFVATSNELNLASFKNDRDSTLYGMRIESDNPDYLIYWSALEGSGKVILRKISESYDSLGGAVFEIHKGSATGSLVTSKDINGVETTSFTSDSSGVYFVDTLSYGTYYIKETTVPDGYSSLDGVNWFILTVSEDGIGYKQADESIVGQIRPEETTP